MTTRARNSFRVNSVIATVSARNYTYGEIKSNRTKATRIYGALDTFAPDQMAEEPYCGQFLFSEKIQPGLWANMSEAERIEMTAKVTEWRRWKRNTVKVAREAAAAHIVRLIGEIDGLRYVPKNESDARVRMHFDQNAGCSSCPCSPGLVLEGQVVDGDGVPVDLWFEVPQEVKV